MKKNQHERMERLQFCNWYSRLYQERYWTGSPWRAISEMKR